MARTTQIEINGILTEVTEFDHSAQEIDDAVEAVKTGNVGGVSSWNDLTDRPFGENEFGAIKQLDNRFLAILNKTGETEIIAEQSFDFSYSVNNGNGIPLYVCAINAQLLATVEVGKYYSITFNGKRYSLIAKHYKDSILDEYYLGNFALKWAGLEEEDTGEDLLVTWLPDDTYAHIITSQSDKTHSFGITQESYVIKEEYLPEGSGDGEYDPGLAGRVETLEEQADELSEQVGKLEQQDKVFAEAAELALEELGKLYERIEGLEGSSGLPPVTTDDNNKILQVVNGAWSVVALADSAVKTYIDDYISSALEGEY